MTISILFSVAIFEITTTEVSARLERFEHNLQMTSGIPKQPVEALRTNEINMASQNIITGLLTANLVVLILGGGLSYLLARLTLRPIKEMHEAQSRFTSDASHELRTPLAAMKTEIEVALRDKSATKKDLEFIMKSNLEEVDKLTNLSQMLLNLSRLDHDKLKSTAVNIKAITQDVIRRYNVSPDRIHIKSAQKSIVLANEPAIVELVSILIDNALKYSPPHSLVLITLSTHENQVCFEIINTGDGIDEKKLPYIFDRFYRADTSRTNRVGYGLGLSLAKKIVELSQGELSVTSTPGQSTIFTALLPAFQPHSSKN
ncbi:MAG: putative Histidine kinase [Candidatus Saccharibacteria bacterium]|nr:putative Histidine kinase [Candidatus Saccharibacteria bacterium]